MLMHRMPWVLCVLHRIRRPPCIYITDLIAMPMAFIIFNYEDHNYCCNFVFFCGIETMNITRVFTKRRGIECCGKCFGNAGVSNATVAVADVGSN